MKTTLDLPDDLMRELKVRAAMEGRRLKDVIGEALRVGLKNRDAFGSPAPRSRITTDPEMGFPLVQCPPDAPASRMSAEQIRRLADESQLEEDLRRAGHSF